MDCRLNPNNPVEYAGNGCYGIPKDTCNDPGNNTFTITSVPGTAKLID